MKTTLRVAAAFLILAALLVALAARILGSEATRTAIEQAGSEAFGRAFHCQDLRIGLFPPSLIVVRPQIAAEKDHQRLSVVASEASFRVALLPLLTGAVVVEMLTVDGPVLNVERTREGVTLPGVAFPVSRDSDDVAPRPGFAVLALEIRAGTIVISDETLSPAVEWRLQAVKGRFDLEPAEESLEFELEMEVAGGGSVEARGRTTFDAEFDAVATIHELALDPLTRYMTVGRDPAGAARPPPLAGFASGSVALRGPISSPELEIDLTLREGMLHLDEIELAGRLEIAAALSGPFGRNEGGFEIDATEAEMRYGGALAKPVGTKASVSGRVVSQNGVHTVDEVHLRIANLDAQARVDFGEHRVATLDAAPADDRGMEHCHADAFDSSSASFDVAEGVPTTRNLRPARLPSRFLRSEEFLSSFSVACR